MSIQTNNPLFPPQSSTLSPIHTHPFSLEGQEADPVVGQGRPLRSPWWGAFGYASVVAGLCAATPARLLATILRSPGKESTP